MNKYFAYFGKLAVTAVAVLTLAACGKGTSNQAEDTQKNEVNLSTSSEISIMDPLKAE